MSYTPPPKCLVGLNAPEPGVVIEPTTPTPSYLLGPTSPYIGTKLEGTSCGPAPAPTWPPNACPVVLSTDCVFYVGTTLVNTNVLANDTVTTALEKIDAVMGAGGDKSFVFTQNLVSAVWTVFHDMDKYPSVGVQDNGGTWQEGQVDHIDDKNLTITYSSGFAGKAYLN